MTQTPTTTRDRLYEVLVRIQNSGISDSDVTRIMKYARELMEEQGFNPQRPKVVLYANWLLHTELSGKQALKILSGITAHLEAATTPAATDAFMRAVNDFLSPTTLRRELLGLFAEHKLPPFILNSQNMWTWFVVRMFQELFSKPLSDPSVGARTLSKSGNTVSRLWLSENAKNQIEWNIEVATNVILRGALRNTEPPSAFAKA